MPRVDVEQLIGEHDLITRDLALEHPIAHVLEVLGHPLLLQVGTALQPCLTALGVDPEVVRPAHRGDLGGRVLVLVRVLRMREVAQHVVMRVPPGLRLLDVLRLDSEQIGKPSDRRTLRAVLELDDCMQVRGLRLHHECLLGFAPDLTLVLVVDDPVGLDDLAPASLQPLHEVGEDRPGILLEQCSAVRIVHRPGPVLPIEVLGNADARGIVLLLSHGDHPRPGQHN